MHRHRTDHPIWPILREQGRYNLVWLAERTGYSHAHVKKVAVGMLPAGPRFRRACAALLGLTEAELFHSDDASSASAPEASDGSDADRAGVVVRPRAYPIRQEVAVGKNA